MVAELEVGGGDWASGAGGYTGSVGDSAGCSAPPTINGISNNSVGTSGGTGASYYTFGKKQTTERNNDPLWINAQIGGQGAFYGDSDSNTWYPCSASGGVAGSGGNITVSENVKIYAYNGDRITNDDYSTEYYEYDKDGNLTTEKLNILKNKNGENFIEATIFAQSGILRKVYVANCGWGTKENHNYEFYHSILGDQIKISSNYSITRPTDLSTRANILIRDEIISESYKTGYINPRNWKMLWYWFWCRLYRSFKWKLYNRCIFELESLYFFKS